MYLKRLEISGFKSFAHHTVLEFTPGLTSIVGPNGSGKSNISDAVRWTLGEQSLKTIRGKKAEDMIFSGSATKARLGMAEVTLTIDNSDKTAAFDYPEIVIRRRLYRTGESEYFLNNARTRLQDIVLFLAKSHFGQKSYAVIGQGMIDAFINATPEDRKEFFDEATGVKSFQLKRDQSLHQLIRTEENLRQGDALIAEIDPRLRSLTRQVKRLERREQIEKQLHETSIHYYQLLWHRIFKEWEEIQTKFRSADDQRALVANDLSELQEAMDAAGTEATRGEIFADLQHQYETILEEKNRATTEQIQLKGAQDTEHNKQGSVHLVWLRRKQDELQGQHDRLKRELVQLGQTIIDQEQTVTEREAEQAQIVKQVQALEYRLLKSKEQLRSGRLLTLPDLHERLDRYFDEQKEFLAALLRAHDPNALKTVKESAKTLTLQFAEIMDALAKEIDAAPTSEELLQLEKQLEQTLKTKEQFLNDLHELRIALETKLEKQRLLSDHLQHLEDELRRTAQEMQTVEQSLQPEKEDRKRLQELQHRHEEITQKIQRWEKNLADVQKKMTQFNQEEQKKKEALLHLQRQARIKQDELNQLTQETTHLEVERARIETRREDLTREIHQEMDATAFQDIRRAEHRAPAGAKEEELQEERKKLKKQLEQIGSIEPEIVEEYRQTKERHEFLTHQAHDLRTALASLEKVIDELDTTIKKQFDQSFRTINREFERYYQMLFQGGKAKLLLLQEAPQAETEEMTPDLPDGGSETIPPVAEPERVLTLGERKGKQKMISGIDIEVSPPGKKIRNVHVLSGGEKTLTSIALLAAILANRPAPFVFLDEVDAALDESNSERFASILQRLSKKTQFVLITHNRVIMQISDILYGVTMQKDGISKLLSVKMEELSDQMIGQ
jgi:chromosome segregation protein